MTVKELKNILTTVSDDTKVLVDGYESGHDDVDGYRETSVHYCEDSWWNGQYHTSESYACRDNCNKQPIKVFIISR